MNFCLGKFTSKMTPQMFEPSYSEKKNMSPLISVVMPVYNGERYLAESIESILKQNVDRIELIIVDDGSTDRTSSIIHEYGQACQYVCQEHRGASAARNRGVNLAKGDFIAFNDADDIWSPDKLSVQLQAFATDPDLDMVFGLIEQFHSPELSEAFKIRVHCPKSHEGQSIVSMLIKKTSFFSIGLFSENWAIGELIDWFIRAKEKHLTYVTVPQIVLYRRLHENNMGIRCRNSYQDYARILKMAMDRQKTAMKKS